MKNKKFLLENFFKKFLSPISVSTNAYITQ